jgi:hypothetical protein
MKKIIKDQSITVERYLLRYVLSETEHDGRADYVFFVEQHGNGYDKQMEVGDICETKSEAEQLYNRLVEGCVTPVSLFEIAEDYVYGKTLVFMKQN